MGVISENFNKYLQVVNTITIRIFQHYIPVYLTNKSWIIGKNSIQVSQDYSQKEKVWIKWGNKIITRLSQIEKRFDFLNISYLKKSLSNKNPIIEELHKEYVQYSESRSFKITTLLCKYRNLVWDCNIKKTKFFENSFIIFIKCQRIYWNIWKTIKKNKTKKNKKIWLI